MYIVVLGWLYVALMMAAAEASHSNGTVLGALVTFVLYGVAPVALVVYLMRTPERKRALKAREAAQWEAQKNAAGSARPQAGSDQPQADSSQPDAGSETPADTVSPVRKKP